MKKSVLVKALTTQGSSSLNARLKEAASKGLEEITAVAGVTASSKQKTVMKKKNLASPNIGYAVTKTQWENIVDSIIDMYSEGLGQEALKAEGIDTKLLRKQLLTNRTLVSNVKRVLTTIVDVGLEDVMNDPWSHRLEQGVVLLKQFEASCDRIAKKAEQARLEENRIQALCNSGHIVLKEGNKFPWAEDMLAAHGYEIIRPDGSKV